MPTGGDCEWVQGHIARALENTFIKNAIKEYSQELGPLRYELTNDGDDGTCRVTIYYNPNPSDEDDATVLSGIKAYVRAIIANDQLMEIAEEFPNIHERINRIRIKDDGDNDDKDGRDDSDDSTMTSKSQKASKETKKSKEPKKYKKSKRAKRDKSGKEKNDMNIFE